MAIGRTLVGPRIRERRKSIGLTQAALAAAAGISASYLNLIESDRRSIGGGLLKRIADRLGLAIDELDGAADRRLVADVGELSGEPFLAGMRLDPDSAADLAGRHPAWARALVALHRSWLDRGQVVAALSDRLNQDPFLGHAVHGMLSNVSAIQSSAEILHTVDGLRPEERRRFISIVHAESGRLADVSQALAAYFDKAHTATRSITPADEVDDFLFDHDNHFPGLETAAADFRAACGISGDCDEATLSDYLERVHSVAVQPCTMSDLDEEGRRRNISFDQASRVLRILDGIPAATRRFLLAREATQRFHQGRAVTEQVAATPLLTSDAARRRASRVLAGYLAGAVLMPYDRFLEEAIGCRYDIDLLARRFEASFEQVCHRLVTLRRPGASGIPFGMMRSGPSGHVSKRFPLPHLPMPRHGSACGLWAIHEAFQAPGVIIRQLAAMPSGERFLFVARTIEKARPRFSMPRRVLSIMLACHALYADRTVYSEGLDLSSSAPATPVGPNCRVCVRRECLYREADAIVAA